ncbi:hypothetical protein YK48G_17320 [Lentilactobacillus fungorum]|uniref:Uncharacterized protein n=1 Tax=Lentilactobacillus fungorum TaxID=2201250 RepID=A0ABQ3W1A8_9LACO|nr:hypothetical protein [Lentilactobacillus fungorum]GHP14307.1 hypothetical protein YK48G_17320 [Lentilactobacillus fungorum]
MLSKTQYDTLMNLSRELLQSYDDLKTLKKKLSTKEPAFIRKTIDAQIARLTRCIHDIDIIADNGDLSQKLKQLDTKPE